MKNEMMVFEGREVEVFECNGRVLFNPRHVAECLDLTESAVRMAISEMNERQVVKLTNSDVNTIDTRKLNNAGENFLTESGVYKLIFKSRKPEAEKFQDWITDEVLPSIRKTGSYKMKKAAKETTDQPINMAPKTVKAFKAYMDLLQTLGIDKNAAAISANQACMKLTGQNTLELLGQTHLEAEKQEVFLTPTELGRKHGKSARELNRILSEKGLQEKHGATWIPTQKGLNFCRMFDTGKRHNSGSPVSQIKWSDSVFASAFEIN